MTKKHNARGWSLLKRVKLPGRVCVTVSGNVDFLQLSLNFLSLSAETNMMMVHTLFHLLVVRPHTQLLLRRRRVTTMRV